MNFMSIAPAPSTSRGDVVLQPNYFTSSVYGKALRDDISTLIFRFHEAFSQSGSTEPFALFKAVWLTLGWNWLQFKVFDNRSRHTFLDVTLRLFLERTVKTEAPFTRVVALFGMYVFYYTQIKDTVPPLYSITNIPIPCDQYLSLKAMPDSLTNALILPLQPHARYVLSCLLKDQVFYILPKSELGAANPRELPREIFTEDGMVFSEQGSQKRKGRPARREKGKKARAALDELAKWTANEAQDKQGTSEIDKALSEYASSKATMLGEDGARLPKGSVEKAGEIVIERLKETQESADDGLMIPRLESMLGGERTGIFGLATR